MSSVSSVARGRDGRVMLSPYTIVCVIISLMKNIRSILFRMVGTYPRFPLREDVLQVYASAAHLYAGFSGFIWKIYMPKLVCIIIEVVKLWLSIRAGSGHSGSGRRKDRVCD